MNHSVRSREIAQLTCLIIDYYNVKKAPKSFFAHILLICLFTRLILRRLSWHQIKFEVGLVFLCCAYCVYIYSLNSGGHILNSEKKSKKKKKSCFHVFSTSYLLLLNGLISIMPIVCFINRKILKNILNASFSLSLFFNLLLFYFSWSHYSSQRYHPGIHKLVDTFTCYAWYLQFVDCNQSETWLLSRYNIIKGRKQILFTWTTVFFI